MNKSSILNLKLFNISLICAFFLIAGGFTNSAFGQEKAPEGSEKKFEPKEIILEHIGDSHSWPVVGEVMLPLPVILYTDKGLEVFSSAKLMPADSAVYHGAHYNYKLEKETVKVVDASGVVDEAATKKVMDFSITRNVASMFMAITILLIVFLSVSSAYKKRVGKAPKGLQSFMEPLILFVRDDIALPNIGVKYLRFMPLLLTIFFFILLNNLLGMVPFFPGGYNLTGNIAVTAVLSVIIFFVVNLNGNKHYWKHIFVPNPWWLFFIMIPVEIVGIFTKPIALMIRLFANITAGHILILSLISLIFIFKTIWVSPVSIVFVVFMDAIELLVAFLQAYIFTLLGALFIGMAIEEHHTEHTEVL
ncbi:F0F1 ATP synthase subunit A [Mucilaginibacter sp. BJC16-A38]|uniref:F0F1 ATP synthase subunit A n=1 Tax=Mucilaginibacter phenanthrenivorans TaxID=1234842 RepID=UPI0021573372|nr:F0F1 ATP synthase subunit A [Mucilaginibacter phenanthrenivorans]MCR8558667.1 F0F1 ATP synthase subunit A [Mucilaginibacter phenanthrenivorans]